MTTSQLCPVCGDTVPLDSPGGLCPRCLLGQGRVPPVIAPPTMAAPAGSFVAPTPAELAPHFPHLEILELLGQGGMGAVYKARQSGLDRWVALKILPPALADDPSFAERFAREARVLARLNHPHIVAVYDSGRAGAYFYLLMEFVDGVNLRAVLQRGTLEPREALAIVPQICEALQFAHEEGIVHRDIKPENVLLDRRGRVKVADFGLAKLVAAPLEDSYLTATHQVMGTPRYMAPEQLEGAKTVDHRADIYSLGVVLYELLTGELPLGRFAPPSQRAAVDARLDQVVLRTLEKEPDRRYQRAGEVKTDLDAISHHSLSPLRRWGYEYRSPLQIGGWPLVHVAYGYDPHTGKMRTARGVIAIGGRAVGVVAVGGLACGIFTMAGVGVGLFTIAGAGLGLLMAFAGCAVSLGLAIGGCAIGTVAVGGVAVGLVGIGGAVLAAYGYGGNVQHPALAHWLTHGAAPLLNVAGVSFILLVPVSLFAGFLLWLAIRTSRRQSPAVGEQPKNVLDKPPAYAADDQATPWAVWMLIGLAIVLGPPLLAVLGYWLLPMGRGAPNAPAAPVPPPSSFDEHVTLPALTPATPYERSVSWVLTENGAEVSPLLEERLRLNERQVAQMNEILRTAWEEYVELEREHWRRNVEPSGQIVTLIPPLADVVAPLENRLWSQLDALLTADQQERARQFLDVYATPLTVGVSVSEISMPGLLGWGHARVLIKVRPVGQWMEWSVHRDNHPAWEHNTRSLPLAFRRFGPPSSATPAQEDDKLE